MSTKKRLLRSFPIALGLALGPGWLATPSQAWANDSSYTSLKDKDCPQVSTAGGGAISECAGRNGFRIFIAADDARSWLVIQKGNVKEDLYEAFATYAPGEFPALAGTPLEWRYGKSPNQPIAFIFRITGNDPNANKTKNKLLVIRVSTDADGRMKLCPLGATTSNEESRVIADGPQGCR